MFPKDNIVIKPAKKFYWLLTKKLNNYDETI